MLSEIAAYLDASTSLTTGTDLFAVEMPPDPNTAVSLHEYDGQGPQDTFGTFSAYEVSRLHVRVRAATYPEAMTLASTVNAALYSIVETAVGGHTYHRVQQISVWTVQEIDSKVRVIISCNYEVTRVP